jgi:hypothetical protein
MAMGHPLNGNPRLSENYRRRGKDSTKFRHIYTIFRLQTPKSKQNEIERKKKLTPPPVYPIGTSRILIILPL